jgi:ferric-dicitrate binding protein FerR (iron transport regulator)
MNTVPDDMERRLRETLDTLASGVHPAQPAREAYRSARGDWLRRERRRRIVLAVLVAVVFALAVAIGLWVLNQAPTGTGAIFTPKLVSVPGG